MLSKLVIILTTALSFMVDLIEEIRFLNNSERLPHPVPSPRERTRNDVLNKKLSELSALVVKFLQSLIIIHHHFISSRSTLTS